MFRFDAFIEFHEIACESKRFDCCSGWGGYIKFHEIACESKRFDCCFGSSPLSGAGHPASADGVKGQVAQSGAPVGHILLGSASDLNAIVEKVAKMIGQLVAVTELDRDWALQLQLRTSRGGWPQMPVRGQ